VYFIIVKNNYVLSNLIVEYNFNSEKSNIEFRFKITFEVYVYKKFPF